MSLLTNLVRRGAVYYFRTRVPRPLRAKVGRNELWRSLRTSQAGEARRRAVRVVALTDALWRALASAMTPEEIQSLIDDWLRAKIEEDASQRMHLPPVKHAGALMDRTGPTTPDRLDGWLDEDWADVWETYPLLCELKGEPDSLYVLRDVTERDVYERGVFKVFGEANARHASGSADIARAHVSDFFGQVGVDIDPASQEFEIATRLMMRAHVRFLEVAKGRSDAKWRRWLDDDPAEAVVQALGPSAPREPAVKPTAETVVERMRFSTAAELFLSETERQQDVGETRLREYRVAIRNFRDWLTSDPEVRDISREIAGAYRLDITHLPINAHKLQDFKDLPLREKIERSRSSGFAKTISAETINSNYISPLRSFFEWASSTGYVTEDPFVGIKSRTSKRRARASERREFKPEELQTFFAQPAFTGAAAPSGKGFYEPGPVRVQDWRYWIALLGCFSGARLGELCGLYVKDFAVEKGVRYFRVTDEEDDQSVKTEAGIRMVPIHHELIRLGLLELVERQRASGSARLFPEIEPGPNGRLSYQPSKFYGRLLDKALGDQPGLVFHSFRHTFISALRNAGVQKDVRMRIVGHEDGEDTHDKYGSDWLKIMNDAVQRVEFTGLDLSKLYAHRSAA